MANPVSAIVSGTDPRFPASRSRPSEPVSGAVPEAPVRAPAGAAQTRDPGSPARLAASSALVTQDGRNLRAPAPPAVAGDSGEAIRAAEDIIQAAFSAPPTAEGRRIAAEAFVMEAQAQREFQIQQAQGMGGRQWTA